MPGPGARDASRKSIRDHASISDEDTVALVTALAVLRARYPGNIITTSVLEDGLDYARHQCPGISAADGLALIARAIEIWRLAGDGAGKQYPEIFVSLVADHRLATQPSVNLKYYGLRHRLTGALLACRVGTTTFDDDPFTAAEFELLDTRGTPWLTASRPAAVQCLDEPWFDYYRSDPNRPYWPDGRFGKTAIHPGDYEVYVVSLTTEAN